jgi:hypothetical protein
MISRKSARLIGECYGTHFRNPLRKTISLLDGQVHELYEETLNNFLFEQDYESWFLQLMRSIIFAGNERKLVRKIMEIHTGETVTPSTQTWTMNQREELGQTLLKKLAGDILKLYETIPVKQLDYSKAETPQEVAILKRLANSARPAAQFSEKLKAQLEMDGYVYRDGHLYPTESSVIDEQAEQNYVELLIGSLNLPDKSTIKHHLKLSEEHYVAKRWDDSISNSRKVLDAILSQVTQAIHLKSDKTPAPAGLLKNATQIREYLEKRGIVTRAERESLDKNYGLLSVTGGHPYIAEKDQARLMRHLALTFSQFVLLRYQGFLDCKTS